VQPSRGEIWYAELSPTVGHEQAGRRPVLIVSIDAFNHGRGKMVVAVPLTRTFRRHPLHVTVVPPEGGLTSVSFALCDNVRAIATERLDQRIGKVTEMTVHRVLQPLRYLLGL
jgi:mRNA interferase MazF